MAGITGKTLQDAVTGGLINEDVMQTVFTLKTRETPFTDMVGSGSHSNPYYSWIEDTLASPDITNAVVEGSDASGDNTALGTRKGNHTQFANKVVKITDVADAVDSIGRTGTVAYQLSLRGAELAQDVEAILLSNQGSQTDDGSSTPGKVASFGAALATNEKGIVDAAGAAGFNTSTTHYAAVVVENASDKTSLTASLIKDMNQDIYLQQGNVTTLMSVPQVIKGINTYLVSDGSAIKTPAQTTVSGSGGGVQQVAQGYFTVIVTDFGTTLKLVPNRIQQAYGASDATSTHNRADLFFVDPSKVQVSYLKGYRSYMLGKTGSSEKWEIDVNFGLKVMNEKHQGVIRNIDWSVAMAD